MTGLKLEIRTQIWRFLILRRQPGGFLGGTTLQISWEQQAHKPSTLGWRLLGETSFHQCYFLPWRHNFPEERTRWSPHPPDQQSESHPDQGPDMKETDRLLVNGRTDRITVIDWATNWPGVTDWLTDWPARWPIDRLTGWWTGWLTGWPTNWLAKLLTDWPACWPGVNNGLSGSITDWLMAHVHKLTGRLTYWMSTWLAAGLTDWLAEWSTERITDQVKECLSVCVCLSIWMY